MHHQAITATSGLIQSCIRMKNVQMWIKDCHHKKNWGTLCSYPLCFWSYIKGLVGPQHPNEIVSERVCPLMRLLKSFNLALWCHWINTGKAEDWMLLIRIREIIRSPFDACHSVILIHTSIFEQSLQIPVIWLLLWKNTCSILCHYLKTY